MKIAITTNEILIPKKLFGAKVDKDLEFDTSIPEYCPDVARLIKVDCTPFAESCEIEDGKATVKGKAVYDVLYETDYKNRLRCCNFTQEFSHSVPLPRSGASGVSAFCDVACERISCKLLSPRRLVVKATLGTQFDIEGEASVKAVAVTEDKNTFFRKKTIGCEGRTALYEDIFRFGESLPLTQSEKCIGEIVCGSVTLQQPQITLTAGRAEIKSVAAVHALCEEENNDGKYYVSVKTLPISIEYLNDAIEDYKHISVTLEPNGCELSQELDQYGENRIIKADFSVKMRLLMNEPKAYTVADDVFEKDFDGIPVIASALFPQLVSQSDVSFSGESKLADVMPSPTALLDTNVSNHASTVEKADGGINLNGVFTVTLLYDSAEGIHSIDHAIPYQRFFPLDIPECEASISAETHPVEAQAVLHADGSATVRVSANARLAVYAQTEESFVSEVAKRTARAASKDDSTLVYCFPKKGESLWEIAKLYRTDPESILNANPTFFDESQTATDTGKPILIKA